MEKIVQTAGRDALGAFAPAFAHYNDDVLFGENWNDDAIDLKTRSILTVVALMSSGVTDSSLKYHLQNAKNHGVTQKEIAAIITHVAFYVGWAQGLGCVQHGKGDLGGGAGGRQRPGKAPGVHGVPHRRTQRGLCEVFHRPELPGSHLHPAGGHPQRDL